MNWSVAVSIAMRSALRSSTTEVGPLCCYLRERAGAEHK